MNDESEYFTDSSFLSSSLLSSFMRTAGQILKEAREKGEKSLEHIARETRIKEKFLSALENADYSVLPNFSIAQGFARNYAQAVEVNPKIVTALLRRDFPQRKQVLQRHEASFSKRSFWTPRTTFVFTIAATLLVLGFYLARQYALFVGAPPLEVSKLIIGDNKILVIGKTVPTATIQVNGRGILVDESGAFSTEIDKPDAGGAVEIKAISRGGKETVIEKTVDER